LRPQSPGVLAGPLFPFVGAIQDVAIYNDALIESPPLRRRCRFLAVGSARLIFNADFSSSSIFQSGNLKSSLLKRHSLV